VVRLLYWESYDDVHKALAREKQLKRWSRAKKTALFERRNPQWKDLAAEWYPWMQPTKTAGTRLGLWKVLMPSPRGCMTS
jgi:hypothetical protein